ncbi:hypothetical protein H4Q32_026114 [Labeo rohita]|uniref:C2H2-type domain-containing protein n=1 Tax=Labeo rohita TaxID=84645 RepID=A0ABQ8L2H8_LABRO|nr:hypothetical protein H4Q32_026114 [Labeo rohita]
MLVKVKFRNEQKYVKVSHSDLKLSDYLDEVFVKFGISVSRRPEARLYDESGTEIDEDVFEDVLKQPNLGVFQILLPDSSNELTHVLPVPSEESSIKISSNESDDTVLLSDDSPTRKRRAEGEAGIMVKNILQTKPGGDGIIREYNKTKCLSDSNRRKMVNILAADMTEKHSSSPPKQVRELYAQGIIALFLYLRDPYAKLGYEHYYDPQSEQGYLSWKIKNIQRNSAPSETRRCVPQSFSGGPSAQREASSSTEVILTKEQYREAVFLMKHTSEEVTVKVKMRETFQYRRKMIHDPSRCTDVLTEFPRYLDIKGLIELDFACLFGEKTAAKFLERWPTTFMQKVIQQSKGLNSSQELQDLIHCAESAVDTESNEDGWGSSLASILLLLHLIPPSALKCGQAGCCLEFGTYSGFRKHLNRVHEASNEVPLHVQDSAVHEAVVGQSSSIDVAKSSNVSSLPISSKNTTDMCASAIAQLQAAGVSQTTINTFVTSMEEVVQDIQDQVKETALRCLSSQNTDIKSEVEQSFETVENPFTSLNSMSKRNSYFSRKWGIVQPVQKVLGVRFDNRKNKSTGLYEQVPVTDKFAYSTGIEGPSSFVRGSIVQITENNLGLHCLFGFVESFRARHSCRFCLTEREDYQTVFCEDESNVIFRTKETHLRHCEAIQADPTLPHVYGVKRTCLLKSLQFFNISDNFVNFINKSSQFFKCSPFSFFREVWKLRRDFVNTANVVPLGL